MEFILVMAKLNSITPVFRVTWSLNHSNMLICKKKKKKNIYEYYYVENS